MPAYLVCKESSKYCILMYYVGTEQSWAILLILNLHMCGPTFAELKNSSKIVSVYDFHYRVLLCFIILGAIYSKGTWDLNLCKWTRFNLERQETDHVLLYCYNYHSSWIGANNILDKMLSNKKYLLSIQKYLLNSICKTRKKIEQMALWGCGNCTWVS